MKPEPNFGFNSYLMMFIHPALVAIISMIYSQVTGSKVLLIILCFVTYLALSLPTYLLIPRYYEKGLKLVRKKDFQEAIFEFEKSYEFFSEHRLVDKFRFITMFSFNGESYRELALCYIAYCYFLSGEREKAKEYYERTLAEFPKSQIARESLESI